MWKFNPIDSGSYASNAQYVIVHANGQTIEYIDWTEQVEPGWYNMGKYTFTNHKSQGVWLSDDADGYLIGDAVKIISVPRIEIDEMEPVAY